LEEEDSKDWQVLQKVDGILVPGGFGDRGVLGKVLAIKYAREKKIPFFGICLGMQMAVIEFARNILDMQDANSTEFDEKTQHPVVIFMPEISKTHMGGTMRLGSRETHIDKSSLAYKLYGKTVVRERHRHRYEVNPKYISALTKSGLVFSGKDDQKARMEITELPDHPFFLGVQYHPEFLSRPTRPCPTFLGFVEASAKHANPDGSIEVKSQNGEVEMKSNKSKKSQVRRSGHVSETEVLQKNKTEKRKGRAKTGGKGKKRKN